MSIDQLFHHIHVAVADLTRYANIMLTETVNSLRPVCSKKSTLLTAVVFRDLNLAATSSPAPKLKYTL